MQRGSCSALALLVVTSGCAAAPQGAAAIPPERHVEPVRPAIASGPTAARPDTGSPEASPAEDRGEHQPPGNDAGAEPGALTQDDAAPRAEAVAPPSAAALPRKIAVRFDKPVFVAHAPPGDRRALVYLHGRCGDVHAYEPWASAVVHFGTLVALQGDVPCKGGWRSSFDHDTPALDRRITAALAAVGAVRGEPLDDRSITLIGYSAGATRAEALASRYPARYPRVVLIGGPTAPAVASLRRAAAVVVMAGARDIRRHLIEATDVLTAAGVTATFMLLPGAKHGEYGPEGPRVMEAAVRWAREHAPDSTSP